MPPAPCKNRRWSDPAGSRASFNDCCRAHGAITPIRTYTPAHLEKPETSRASVLSDCTRQRRGSGEPLPLELLWLTRPYSVK